MTAAAVMPAVFQIKIRRHVMPVAAQGAQLSEAAMRPPRDIVRTQNGIAFGLQFGQHLLERNGGG